MSAVLNMFTIIVFLSVVDDCVSEHASFAYRVASVYAYQVELRFMHRACMCHEVNRLAARK